MGLKIIGGPIWWMGVWIHACTGVKTWSLQNLILLKEHFLSDWWAKFLSSFYKKNYSSLKLF
jgi:hypothetical protein